MSRSKKNQLKRRVNRAVETSQSEVIHRAIVSTDTRNLANSKDVDRISLLVKIFFFLFMFWFWSYRYRDFIFMVQEYDLFIWDLDYFTDSISRVAGLSRWLSSFILQFFYYPTLGGTLMACVMSFVQHATQKLFKLDKRLFFVSFIPPCILTLQIININYFVFERFDLAYLFGLTFGYAFSLLLVIIFTALQQNRWSMLLLILGLVLLYPVLGFFALQACFLCLLKIISHFSRFNYPNHSSRVTNDIKSPDGSSSQNSNFVNVEFLLLFILLVPILYWSMFSSTSPTLQHMYVAGLCQESPLTQGRDNLTNIFFSSCLVFMVSFPLVFGIFDIIRSRVGLRKSKENHTKKNSMAQTFDLVSTVSYCLIPVVCVITFFSAFSTPNFLQFLKIAREIDKKNWEGILSIESSIESPSSPAITARLLALTRLNRLSDDIFLRPVYPEETPQLIKVQTFGMCGDRILLEFGLTNCAERIAFNNYVVKRGRTFWGLKTLAMCAAIDGRRSLAERYLFRMKKTLFHKRFANEMLDYLSRYEDNQSRFAFYTKTNLSTSELRLNEVAKQIKEIRDLAPLSDDLAFSETTNSAYYGMIQEEEASKLDRQKMENHLAFLLLMRNLPLFSVRFDNYINYFQSEQIPKSLEEAALLRERFPQVFNPNELSWSIPQKIKVTPLTRMRFERYLKIVNDSGIDASSKMTSVQSEFGDTFWGFICIPGVIEYY